ncbi:MAG: GNAT family N-acetyltransferase [Deltaproteobacteria bacterium]|nr:GNAT family N-acetyltransferase [Deltaproteobacteria bacterium]
MMKDQIITYRSEVRPSDREHIRQLVEATGFFSPQEIDIAIELVEERLAKGNRSGYHFLFAELSGSIIGYTCFGPIPGTLHSHDLYWIVVHHSFRRLGIGKSLLAHTEELISDRGGWLIYTDTSSRDQYEATRRFYTDCGYRQEALLRDFYSPGDSKIIYVKTVSSKNRVE